jgi:hypothetical protein
MKEFQIPRKLIALVKASMSKLCAKLESRTYCLNLYPQKMVAGKEMPWPAYFLT